MKNPFRVRTAVLLALVTVIATPTLFAKDRPGIPVPTVAPVPAAPPEPPVPPEPPDIALAALDDDGDEGPVREALREAQSELRGAHEEVARAMRDVQRHVKTFRMDAGGPNASRLLIIPAADASGESVAQIREDLTIMSRLLQKTTFPDGQNRNGFRFDFGDLRFGGRTELDALYLDGYGAVFLLNVDYPLSSPAKEDSKKVETKDKKDEAWEKARREVAGKGEPDDLEGEPEPDEARSFDSSKVDRLKQRVIAALRSAANIRTLKPKDNVVVQVTGKAGKRSKAVSVHATGGGGTVFTKETRSDAGSAVLTFRVPGKEVVDFSEGRLSAEEFTQRVNTTLLDEPDASSSKSRKF